MLLPCGLRLLPHFLSPSALPIALAETTSVHEAFLQSVKNNNNDDDLIIKTAHVPQPKLQTSQQHNLSSEEKFMSVSVNGLNGEFFAEYGEPGHSLLYLRGNKNIPPWHRTYLLPALESLPEVEEAISQRRGRQQQQDAWDWRQTVNVYTQNDGRGGGERAGFGWHVDIPANGLITMILTLQATGTLELRPVDAKLQGKEDGGDDVASVELTEGSLLVLSGEARWDWAHRIVPSLDGGERVSVVFGCH